MPVTSYSTTPGSNNSAPPNGAPEGMAPSSVNDVIRQVMSDIALEAQTNNVKVLKSVAGTNTITADMDPELGAYVAGMIVVFTPAATNTGASTISIDGLAAISIKKHGGSALDAGDLLINIPALLVLASSGTDFLLMNPQKITASNIDGVALSGLAQVTSGSFTGTLTGCTTSPTASFSYTKVNNVVTLSAGATLTATSNSTSMSVTGLPVGITPAGSQLVPCGLTDNSTNDIVGACQINLTGSLIFFKQNSGQYQATGFTSSGTKGITSDFNVTYSMV